MADNMNCPLCGCDDLDTNSWIMDDADGPFSEVPALECRNCKAGAPVEAWNRRPDPWRYPPDLPEDGQRILFTYQHPDGHESDAITAVYSNVKDWHPIVRWMPVPERSPRSEN